MSERHITLSRGGEYVSQTWVIFWHITWTRPHYYINIRVSLILICSDTRRFSSTVNISASLVLVISSTCRPFSSNIELLTFPTKLSLSQFLLVFIFSFCSFLFSVLLTIACLFVLSMLTIACLFVLYMLTIASYVILWFMSYDYTIDIFKLLTAEELYLLLLGL